MFILNAPGLYFYFKVGKCGTFCKVAVSQQLLYNVNHDRITSCSVRGNMFSAGGRILKCGLILTSSSEGKGQFIEVDFKVLTVVSSFSTQSGVTLCKWVRWSWRCILLLRTS